MHRLVLALAGVEGVLRVPMNTALLWCCTTFHLRALPEGGGRGGGLGALLPRVYHTVCVLAVTVSRVTPTELLLHRRSSRGDCVGVWCWIAQRAAGPFGLGHFGCSSPSSAQPSSAHGAGRLRLGEDAPVASRRSALSWLHMGGIVQDVRAGGTRGRAQEATASFGRPGLFRSCCRHPTAAVRHSALLPKPRSSGCVITKLQANKRLPR